MKEYRKPELQVREIRVTENLAAKLNLRDKQVLTKYNMLALSGSLQTTLTPIEE